LHDGAAGPAKQRAFEVIDRSHNLLVGDARLSPNECRSRTNIGPSQWKARPDLAPIESGRFGPVRLVPVAP
jgi:hypothetical protein